MKILFTESQKTVLSRISYDPSFSWDKGTTTTAELLTDLANSTILSEEEFIDDNLMILEQALMNEYFKKNFNFSNLFFHSYIKSIILAIERKCSDLQPVQEMALSLFCMGRLCLDGKAGLIESGGEEHFLMKKNTKT